MDIHLLLTHSELKSIGEFIQQLHSWSLLFPLSHRWCRETVIYNKLHSPFYSIWCLSRYSHAVFTQRHLLFMGCQVAYVLQVDGSGKVTLTNLINEQQFKLSPYWFQKTCLPIFWLTYFDIVLVVNVIKYLEHWVSKAHNFLSAISKYVFSRHQGRKTCVQKSEVCTEKKCHFSPLDLLQIAQDISPHLCSPLDLLRFVIVLISQ